MVISVSIRFGTRYATIRALPQSSLRLRLSKISRYPPVRVGKCLRSAAVFRRFSWPEELALAAIVYASSADGILISHRWDCSILDPPPKGHVSQRAEPALPP